MNYLRLAMSATVAALLTVAVPAGVARAENPNVPVAGSFEYTPGRSSANGTMKGVFHAVQRIPDGTVVYFSIGSNDDSAIGKPPLSLFDDLAILDKYLPGWASRVEIIDAAGLKRYRPMQIGTTCLCSKITDLGRPTTGKLYAGYAILPELPAGLSTVTVRGFYGSTVTNVPVGDGVLEPLSAQTTSIVDLESGWPTVPVDQAAAVSAPQQYILPLTRRTSDIKQTVRKSESSDKVSVELGADVLFAVDSARLTSAASSTLDALAKDIAARGRGVVTIVGHTDSTGSSAHNLTLSRQRANSVLAALKAGAEGAKVTYAATGKGEADPVATNSTAAGRQLNRRVTVTYSVGAS